MSYKVDIFKLLGDMSKGKMSSIDSLSDEELKSVSPYVLQMWVRGASSNLEARIQLTNEFVNPYIFTLQDHPKLLFKLLCYANGLNEEVRFQFKKKSSKKSTEFKVKTLMKYYNYNYSHASDILPLLNERDLLEIGEDLGYEKDELKKLMK